MEIEIRAITKENERVLALPNDPFLNEGRVIPIYDGAKWEYRIEEFAPEKVTEDCFPDENYKLDEMGKDFHGLAAYIDGKCVGFAILYTQWHKWLYIDNLLVPKDARRLGVGSALVEASMELAKELNKVGLWLVCQDNNLQAMRFYLSNGFVLGGMDTMSYKGTKQEGKTDLFLYKAL